MERCPRLRACGALRSGRGKASIWKRSTASLGSLAGPISGSGKRSSAVGSADLRRQNRMHPGGCRGSKPTSLGAALLTPMRATSACGSTRKHWLDHRVLRPRTVELYQGLLDRYILPSLGEVQLGRLTPLTVRSWHSKMAKAGKPGPITIAKAYRLLKTICSTAVADELIVRNPCNVKGAAVERSKERPVLSVAQMDTLVGLIDPRYRGMVLLGSWCGLRLGELSVLTRGDVDLVNGHVNITKSAAELKEWRACDRIAEDRRWNSKVAIPPHVLPAIEAHLNNFTGPENADLVFVGTQGRLCVELRSIQLG